MMNQQNHVGDCNVEGIVRKGTKLGSRHMRLGLNNQDAVLSEEFYIPSTKKNYYVGLVSDGCTGFPFFSNTEVGSRLLSVFAYDRIQQFLCSGIEMCDVPRVLYGACAQYLQSLTALTLSHSTIWKYPVEHKVLDGRTAQDRLQSDYFAATLMGFISDGNEVIIFTAGDGLVLLNKQITVIDQNDHPEYIINNPANEFKSQVWLVKDITKFALMSDGLSQLIKVPEFIDELFSDEVGNILHVQKVLNQAYEKHADIMGDDCSIVTFQ